MTVRWHPQALNAKLRLAFVAASRDYFSLARARFPSRTVAATMGLRVAGNVAGVTSNDPRVGFFEEGVGEHIIEPKAGTVLRMADGGFVTGPVLHPGMAAQPTLKPLLGAFPHLYRTRARRLV